MTSVTKVPFVLLLLGASAFAQTTCPSYPLVAISAISSTATPENTCVSVVGAVTFVKKFEDLYRFEVMSADDHSIMVTSSEEPYTSEKVQVYGHVENTLVGFTTSYVEVPSPNANPRVSQTKIIKVQEPKNVLSIKAESVLVVEGALKQRSGTRHK